MGKAMSMLSRKLNRFNAENRAQRWLEREKPVAAPKYESNLRDMERTLEADPQFIEKLNKKDTELDNRLKSVYVTSEDSFIDYAALRKEDPDRPLPRLREQTIDHDYGYMEPRKVTPGCVTLRQAVKFITDHNSDPEVWTKEKIAKEYNVKEEEIANVLHYFKSFNVYIPDKGQRERILTQTKPKKLLEEKPDDSK